MPTFFRTLSFVFLLLMTATAFPQEASQRLNISGTWDIKAQMGDLKAMPTFTFLQEGEKLSGHYHNALGDVPLQGSLQGNTITFSFKTSLHGSQFEVSYTGTVARDSMRGTVKAENLGRGSFTGQKRSN